MATLSKQYTFSNDTIADAPKVNVNFDDIIAFINGSVVHKDGSTTMTGILALPNTDPTTNNQATRKSYVDAKAAAAQAAAQTYAEGLSGNDMAGSSVLTGSYVAQPMLHKGGQQTGSVDGSGNISVAWPSGHRFANGVVSVTATLKSGGTINFLQAAVAVVSIDTTGCIFRIYNPATGASYAAGTVTVMWHAIGF